MPSPLDRVLACLPQAKRVGHRYCAPCPAHQGEHRDSLSLCEAEDGKILLHCFGGCDTADVLRALGLEWKNLFSEPAGNGHRPTRKRPRRRYETTAEEEAARVTERLAAEYVLYCFEPPGPVGPPTEAMGVYTVFRDDLWNLFMADESPAAIQAYWQRRSGELARAAPRLVAAVAQRRSHTAKTGGTPTRR